MSLPVTKYINAGPMQAQANAGPAMAAGQAMAQVGNAIANVGEQGLELLGKTRRIKEGGAIAAFMANAQETAGSFANELARRSDTDAWVQDWKNKAEDLNQQSKALGLSPEGMASLSADLTGWQSKQAINFETQALSKSLGIAHAQAGQALDYHAARGDKTQFDRTLGHAVDAGIYNPAEVEKANLNFKEQEAAQDIQRGLQGNPKGMIDIDPQEILNRMPGATLQMVERGKRQAEALIQKRREGEMDSLEARLDSGQLSPRDIEGGQYLTPHDVSKLAKALKKVDPPTAEAHGKVWDLLLSNRKNFTDPAVSDADYAARWNDLRSEVIGMVPAEFRGDISQELNYRSPANRTEAKTRPRPSNDIQELKSIALERITRARDSNLLGSADKEADPVSREKAFRRADDLRVQTSSFIRDTPNLTLTKVTEFTDGLISGDRVKSTTNELRQFVPGSAQRLRPAPAMPPLPPKSGTKDKATADPLQIPSGSGQATGALLPPVQQLNDFLK